MRQDHLPSLFDHMLAMPPSSLHKQSSPVYSGYSKGYFWPILVHFPLAGVLLSWLCRLKNMVGLYSHNLTRLRSPLLFKIIYGQSIIYNNVNLQCPWSSYNQRRKNVIVELQFTHRHISTFCKVFDSFLFYQKLSAGPSQSTCKMGRKKNTETSHPARPNTVLESQNGITELLRVEKTSKFIKPTHCS